MLFAWAFICVTAAMYLIGAWELGLVALVCSVACMLFRG